MRWDSKTCTVRCEKCGVTHQLWEKSHPQVERERLEAPRSSFAD